ncbi:MAG: hypothetical protein QN178_12735 [Armatimonadota bacterium]|nr:hypothetical protein [Armatimonadota bacterium]
MRPLQYAFASVVIAALILTSLAPTTWSNSVAQAQTADPPGRVGRLNYMSGQVSFAPGGVNEWAAAVLNYPLTTGTALWTDENARAEFHVGSTAVRLDEFTEVDILTLDDQAIQLRVPQETVDIGIRHLDAGERFEIGTPVAAVALTRSGHYRLDVDEAGGSVRIAVRSGQADVSTSRATFSVRTGQTVVVSNNSTSVYEVIPTGTLDEFGQWALAREQQEAQAIQAIAPYVPVTMTGFQDLAYHGTWRRVAGYGYVWYPRVHRGWTPYRHGRWMYVSPWGWTWIDDAPWGFAPFHYGRWALINGYWVWVPGHLPIRPIFAPALVVFVILGGGGIGWFPLAPREIYVPPYRTSPTYYRNINITIINVTIVNVTRVKYVHRHLPKAITVIRPDVFRQSGRVDTSLVAVAQPVLAGASVAAAPPAQATLPSLLGNSGEKPAHKPPVTAQERPVIVNTTPPPPAAPPQLGQQVSGRPAPVRPMPDARRAVTPQPALQPTPRPTPRNDQVPPTPPPAVPPVPQPRPTEPATVVTPGPGPGGVPTPRARPTPQTDQPRPTPQPTLQQPAPQPTSQPTQRPGSRPDDARGRGPGNVKAAPNCDPRSRDYDPAGCPKPTPTATRTKGK